MTDDKKKIGIEQFIPFDLLNETLFEYLSTKEIDKAALFQKILGYNKGENRAKKATNSIYSTITKSSVIKRAILKNLPAVSYEKLSVAEKNVIAMSLVCVRFPFVFETLAAFGKLFGVQERVNRQYIKQTLADIYGSNRSLDIALDAALRMIVDFGFIKRVKQGLFDKGASSSLGDFAKETWVATFFELNGRKTISVSDLRYEPVLSYLSDISIDWKQAKILETCGDNANQTIITGISKMYL